MLWDFVGRVFVLWDLFSCCGIDFCVMGLVFKLWDLFLCCGICFCVVEIRF